MKRRRWDVGDAKPILKRAKNQTEAVNIYTNYNSYNKTGILSNYFSSLMFFLERYVIKLLNIKQIRKSSPRGNILKCTQDGKNFIFDYRVFSTRQAQSK